MRVLGIDPGLTRCGIGVVDALSARRVKLIDTGVARSSADEELGPRLLRISRAVETWIAEYEPQVVALERVFAQHNLTTVMGTAQVSGVVLRAAAERDIPVALHTPSEVKRAVTGYGGAQKQQVQTMVAKILGLAEAPKPADAADALALAICHLWRGPALSSQYSQASGATSNAVGTGRVTPAQKAWLAAEKAARRGTARR